MVLFIWREWRGGNLTSWQEGSGFDSQTCRTPHVCVGSLEFSSFHPQSKDMLIIGWLITLNCLWGCVSVVCDPHPMSTGIGSNNPARINCIEGWLIYFSIVAEGGTAALMRYKALNFFTLCICNSCETHLINKEWCVFSQIHSLPSI